MVEKENKVYLIFEIIKNLAGIVEEDEEQNIIFQILEVIIKHRTNGKNRTFI